MVCLRSGAVVRDEEYVRLLREAWLIARGERLAEMDGRRLRLLDDSGIHPWSYVWGKIVMLENALGLNDIYGSYARLHDLREEAREEAQTEWERNHRRSHVLERLAS